MILNGKRGAIGFGRAQENVFACLFAVVAAIDHILTKFNKNSKVKTSSLLKNKTTPLKLHFSNLVS